MAKTQVKKVAPKKDNLKEAAKHLNNAAASLEAEYVKTGSNQEALKVRAADARRLAKRIG